MDIQINDDHNSTYFQMVSQTTYGETSSEAGDIIMKMVSEYVTSKEKTTNVEINITMK